MYWTNLQRKPTAGLNIMSVFPKKNGGYSTETTVAAHKIGYLGRWELNTFTFMKKKKMAY